jgi:hypothetical protein
MTIDTATTRNKRRVDGRRAFGEIRRFSCSAGPLRRVGDR